MAILRQFISSANGRLLPESFTRQAARQAYDFAFRFSDVVINDDRIGMAGPIEVAIDFGWLTRHYEPTVPSQVTYTITKRVMELDSVMTDLDRIAERWYGKNAKGS